MHSAVAIAQSMYDDGMGGASAGPPNNHHFENNMRTSLFTVTLSRIYSVDVIHWSPIRCVFLAAFASLTLCGSIHLRTHSHTADSSRSIHVCYKVANRHTRTHARPNYICDDRPNGSMYRRTHQVFFVGSFVCTHSISRRTISEVVLLCCTSVPSDKLARMVRFLSFSNLFRFGWIRLTKHSSYVVETNIWNYENAEQVKNWNNFTILCAVQSKWSEILFKKDTNTIDQNHEG